MQNAEPRIEQTSDKPAVVLIHGLWMTPRSWEHWIARFERRGYEVLAPAYPGLEVEVEALREDPSPIADVTVPQTVEALETLIRGLDRPPLLMGHSFGGALVQILLDHGFGAAGVAIDSVPDRARARGARLADQGQLPGPPQPGQPPSRGRLHAGAVPLRVHEHAERGGLGQGL